MRILFLAGLTMLAAPLVASPRAPAKYPTPITSAAPNHCPRPAAYQAYDRGKVSEPRKLSELPGAHQFAAVYRTVDGCEVPLVVRYNVDR